ncbi:MAG TPA: hypothetical protein VGP72_02380 [Planctomycetota bacterium]|jgi:hypothetical protein
MPKNRVASLFVIAVGLCLLTACESPDDKHREQSESSDAISKKLRGYGTLKVSFQKINAAGGTCDLWTFQTESQEKACTAVGKLLADLTLSPGVGREELLIDGVRYPLIGVSGGASYSGFVLDKTGYVIAAESSALIQKAFEMPAALGIKDLSKAVTALPYPQFLDRFDRYGWGFYGVEAPGTAEPKEDPAEDLAFCAKHNFRIEMWPQPANHSDSFSVTAWEAMRWRTTECERLGIPISARLYGGGGLNILPIRKELSELHQLPLPWLDGGWYGASLEYRCAPQQSWYNKNAQLYMVRQTQEQIRGMLRIAPQVGSWMLPYGELANEPLTEFHGDHSPAALESWRETLRAGNKLSLDEVSRMYRVPKPFRSWDEVPIPEFATFFGLDGMVKPLDNSWYVRPEETADQGVKEEWWKADVQAGGWEKVDVPGDVRVHKYFRVKKWFVRDFELKAGELPDKPIYLYSFACVSNTDARNKAVIYMNGQTIGETGNWGAWSVSKYLKTGINRIAFRLPTEFHGHVFLSVEPPAVYPYLGAERNRLFRIFTEWASFTGKYASAETVLAGMRQADPDRPIKIMCMPMTMFDLAERYGAWGHFTGEGVWFHPWYKRYGFLYGVPGTSEGGGPCDTVEQMIMLYQRVFLEGLNAHDEVFVVQHITRRPALKQWWEEHIALLKQMGRYDIAGPQVVLYRPLDASVDFTPIPLPEGAKSRTVQRNWNWDIGRGTLQSIGHSYLYADERALQQGKLAGYPVLMDCGTEVLTPDAVSNIEKWVREGGTFITWPFTGRCLPDEPDSWPIAKLTGCKVKALRAPGKGSITIGQQQSIFRELADKTFPDNGSSKDWQDFEHNLVSTELEPGPNCEVLATFENGAPAIILHKLGNGRVVSLGSAFFRGAHDQKGIWWPEELESTFFRDLLNGLGLKSVNTSSDLRVWPQRYRTNNGLDEVVVLCNFAGADRTVTLNVKMEKRPTKIFRAAMNSMTEVIDFTFESGSVKIAGVQVPKDEVQVFYFRENSPLAAAEHWWKYQQTMWRPSDTSVKVDLDPISHGHWVDPTLDLKRDWKWTQESQTSDAWTQNIDDSSWRSWDLDIFNAVGADPKKPVYARKVFSVPSAWLKEGHTRLTTRGHDRDFLVGDSTCKVYLNGKLLPKAGYQFVEEHLKEKDNVLALEISPPRWGGYIGVWGSVYMAHEKLPVQTLSLAGEWTAVLDGKPITVQFPGKAKCVEPTRSVHIPAEWKDKYVVTYYALGAHPCALGAIVNNRFPIRQGFHCSGEAEVDITDFLDFGKDNLITPLYSIGPYVGKKGKPLDWEFSKIELRLYPRKNNRGQ